jgi:hypothetical protein
MPYPHVTQLETVRRQALEAAATRARATRMTRPGRRPALLTLLRPFAWRRRTSLASPAGTC